MPRGLQAKGLQAKGLQAELKQKAPFASREQEAYLSVLRTADALQAQGEARLKEFGLTGTQYNALRILRGAGTEGLPCREIGDRKIKHKPAIKRLINRLEGRRFVEPRGARPDSSIIYGKIPAAGLRLL